MSDPVTKTDAPRPAAPARRRWTRRLLWGLATVLLLSALAWLGVPPLVRWQGQKIASEQLGRAVQIGEVAFNPWTLELTVQDIEVAGADGAPPQLHVERVYANAAWQSIVRLAPVLDALQVQAPALRLVHRGDGHYDVDDILARLAAAPKSEDAGKPARFALYNIEIRDGRLDFDDQAVQEQQELRELKLALPFISSLPSAREVTVRPELAFALNGSRFDSNAQALPFDDSRRTDAVLRLQALDLAPYLGYLPAGLPLRLQAGVLDAELQLHFEEAPQQSLRIDGTLALSGLQALDAAGAQALTLDALRLELAELRPLEGRLHLSNVELVQPHLTLLRDAGGALNLQPVPAAGGEEAADAAASAGAQAPVMPAPAEAEGSTPGFELLVDQLALRDGRVDFRDDSTTASAGEAAALRLDALALQASAIAWPLEQPLSFSGSTRLVEPGAAPTEAAPADAQATSPDAGATLAFEGRASLQQAEATARLAGVPLKLARPYLAAYLVPRLEGGLEAELGVQWAPAATPDAEPELKLAVRQLVLDRLALMGEGASTTRSGTARRAAGPRTGELARIEQLSLTDAQIDLSARTVQVAEMALQRPWLQAERSRDGRWMAEQWVRSLDTPAADGKAPAAAESETAPWAVGLEALKLREGSVDYADLATVQPVRAQLTQLRLDAGKLQLAGKQSMPLELSARLGTGRRGAEAGRLSWRGQLTLEPLTAQGELTAERLPVHAFTPYFDQALNIDILRADASYKGRVAFAETPRGPRLTVAGDARVEELRTHSRPDSSAGGSSDAGTTTGPAVASRAALAPTAVRPAGGLGEELLSWKQLRLAGLDLRLEPGQAPRVSVGSTRLSDFFARLIIHPNGRFNLQDVLKSDAEDAPQAAAASATPAVGMPAAGEFSSVEVAAGAGQAVTAAPAAAPPDPLAPVLQFGPTELVNGRIDFSDHFIRPNYSADLTELNGSLGAFASVAPEGAPQMAELRLAGRAEGSAALEVSGQLNPLASPLALDIEARVSDLDLPPLSPYSVKYAGHGIERGKLSMDVAYKIEPEARLTATNRLVLNQLQFGEPVEGAPASLPVQLATALLADSNGVIDLDLPISGSLNDPEFSLGPIIVKAVVNLIGKALTAPFTLLARALGGGGEDLSSVAFAPGSTRLDDKARQQLDHIAKALTERPQLKLTVVGTADLAAEDEGFRRERLQALVAAEQRGEKPELGPETAPPATEDSPPEPSEPEAAPADEAAGPDAAADQVSAEQYPVLLKRLYRRADIPDKPRNAIGMQRDISVPEMEALLMAQIPADQDAIRQLAVRRGVAVKDYLAGHGVPAERLFLGAARTDAASGKAAGAAAAEATAEAEAPWSPRAELNLGMK